MPTRRSIITGSLLAAATAAVGSPTLSVQGRQDTAEPRMPTPDIRIALRLTALDGGALESAAYDATANILFNRAEAMDLQSAYMRTVRPDRLILQVAGEVEVDLVMTALTTRGLVELVDPKGVLLEPGSFIITSGGGEPWPR